MEKALNILAISTAGIDRIWFDVEEMIAESLKYSDGKFSLDSVYQNLKTAALQLWIISEDKKIKAFIITQIIQYPAKKILVFMFIGGSEFEAWEHFIETFKSFAKHHHCEAIEGYGRKGWFKKIMNLGFEQIHSVYRLALED